MPLDPSLSPLPPEWVEAIRGAVRDDIAWVHYTAVERITDAAVGALAPLLAERDRERDQAALAEARRWCRRARDYAEDFWRVEEEARRLREALEWYGDEVNYDEDGVPGEYVGAATDPETGAFEGEWDPDRGGRARAALSASPVPEESTSDSSTSDEVAKSEVASPVSVPEQEEEHPTVFVSTLRQKLAQMELHDDLPDSHDIGYMACWRELRDWLDAADEHDPAAASSSSSEEGERAHAREWTISKVADFGAFVTDGPDTSPPKGSGLKGTDWLAAACVRVVAKDDVLAWLRERLTSDEAVDAWLGAVCSIYPALPGDDHREITRLRLAAVADCLDNRTEGGRHG